jgi:hypothetical protein
VVGVRAAQRRHVDVSPSGAAPSGPVTTPGFGAITMTSVTPGGTAAAKPTTEI